MKQERYLFRTNCFFKSLLALFLSIVFSWTTASAHVDTGGPATTKDHGKNVVGYITNWDAWKAQSAGVPKQGSLTHINVDFNKYTILNYAFFGVAVDGSLHSGDYRNKNIYAEGTEQAPSPMLNTDVYSSFDLHILYGEMEGCWWITEEVASRARAFGFETSAGSSTWSNKAWGVENAPLPLPLPKRGGAKGLIEEAHDRGVKLMASLGGWSMCRHFPEVAADPVKRKRFVEGCKRLIAMGFDGVDIDWEYPGPFTGMNFTGSDADYGNFLTLMQEIRAGIGEDKFLSAAFSVDVEKLEGFDWVALDQVMDLFNIMTYDFNGGWSDKAGFLSNVHDYQGSDVSRFNWDTLRDFLIRSDIPREKVNLGIPFYGRGMVCDGPGGLNNPTVKRDEFIQPDGNIVTSADYTNWPKEVYDGTPTYFFIKQVTEGAGSGWVQHWDNEADVPYLTKGPYFLSYETPESVEVKSQYIVDNDFGGSIVWTVYGDLELGGTATSYGPKLVKYSQVKSELVNKINEVFAEGGDPQPERLTVSLPRTVAATAGVPVEITATVKGGTSPYAISWSFGATGNPVSHRFDTAGEYPVLVTVVDGANNRASATATAHVTGVPTPEPITGNAGGPYTGKTGVALSMVGTASGGTGTRSFAWAFGDGTTAVGSRVSHAYAAAGRYDVRLTVTDTAGKTATFATTATVTKDSSSPCGGLESWSSKSTYVGGNRAAHNGHRWEAKWWSRGNEPGTGGPWGPWRDLGACTP